MSEVDLFVSPKSRLTTLILAAVLGVFGAHRFYAGRVRSALLMLLTLGGLGIWYLYDLIMISAGSFRDGEGRLISNWEPDQEHMAGTLSASAVLDELDALRAEVNELHERVEFAERLLADPNRGARTPA